MEPHVITQIIAILLITMIEYKYVNDTEAALKRIKATCKMKKCKPKFQVRIGQSHHHRLMEGTIKQVEFILKNLVRQKIR